MDEQTRQSLDSYIKESSAQGFSRLEIEQALLAAGWQADMIAEGFGQPQPIIPVPEFPKKGMAISRFKWPALGVVGAGLIAAAVWYFWPTPPSVSIPEKPVASSQSAVPDTAAPVPELPPITGVVVFSPPPSEEAPASAPGSEQSLVWGGNSGTGSAQVINFSKEEGYIFQAADNTTEIASILAKYPDNPFTVPYCAVMSRHVDQESVVLSDTKSSIALADEGVKVWLRCSRESGNKKGRALLYGSETAQFSPSELANGLRAIACDQKEKATNNDYKRVLTEHLSSMIDRQKYDACAAGRTALESSARFKNCTARVEEAVKKFVSLQCQPGDENTVGGLANCGGKARLTAAGLSEQEAESIIKTRGSEHDDFYTLLLPGCLEGKI